MKLALFYDTETSGLPLFEQPSEDPRQPHIVQMAARLVDIDTRKPVAGFELVVRPDGWAIPDDVARVHGITTELAELIGISEKRAIGMLIDLWGRAAFRVAPNEPFDARIVRIGLKRFGHTDVTDTWKAGAAECTALMSTPICALPPTAKMRAAGRNHHKTANLQEAHRHFFGRDFDGAHSAGADVDACARVWFAIKDHHATAAQASEPAAN